MYIHIDIHNFSFYSTDDWNENSFQKIKEKNILHLKSILENSVSKHVHTIVIIDDLMYLRSMRKEMFVLTKEYNKMIQQHRGEFGIDGRTRKCEPLREQNDDYNAYNDTNDNDDSSNDDDEINHHNDKDNDHDKILDKNDNGSDDYYSDNDNNNYKYDSNDNDIDNEDSRMRNKTNVDINPKTNFQDKIQKNKNLEKDKNNKNRNKNEIIDNGHHIDKNYELNYKTFMSVQVKTNVVIALKRNSLRIGTNFIDEKTINKIFENFEVFNCNFVHERNNFIINSDTFER
jgi:hypothetical protein